MHIDLNKLDEKLLRDFLDEKKEAYIQHQEDKDIKLCDTLGYKDGYNLSRRT